MLHHYHPSPPAAASAITATLRCCRLRAHLPLPASLYEHTNLPDESWLLGSGMEAGQWQHHQLQS